MSSTTDKIKGLANEAMGNVKQGIGNVTGDEKLKAEGKAQEMKGETVLTAADHVRGRRSRPAPQTVGRLADHIIRRSFCVSSGFSSMKCPRKIAATRAVNAPY